MVIYLKHPVHGTKVACSELEAEYDAGNGWEVFEPTKKIEQSVAEPIVNDEISVNQLKPRGRPRKKD